MGFNKFESLIITEHSINRYLERSQIKIDYKSAAEKIKIHLKESEIDKSENRLLKTRKKKNPDCIYYKHDGWRFVIKQSENKFILMTCERRKKIQN